MLTVYLAGPISGQNYKDATSWREHCESLPGFVWLSPMRAKEVLKSSKDLTQHTLSSSVQNFTTTDDFIMTRDYSDVKRSDVLLVNLDVPHPTPSLGTVMELGWAYDRGIPTIVIDSAVHQYKNHPMIKHTMSIVASSLEEALVILKTFPGKNE
jgi:nucleoside 2-deoxyribosyltransferase